MKSYDIHYATKEDLMRWYKGKLPPVSVRAQVLEIDGEIEAIWGVQLSKGDVVAFSTVNEKARGDKRAILACVRASKELLQKHPHVIAYADKDEPTADAFIRHCGFVHVGSSNRGEVYLYV